jgi:hypothetical protein
VNVVPKCQCPSVEQNRSPARPPSTSTRHEFVFQP